MTHISPQSSQLQLTPAFLNSVLRPFLETDHAMVIEVKEEQLAGQFNADLRRLFLTYDQPAGMALQSLIAKLPTTDSRLNERAAVFQPGSRENWFYSSAASRSSVPIPFCYYNAIDNATGQSILLLEDLSHAPTGNQFKGATVEQAELALTSLARLHAGWWNDTSSMAIQELMQLIAQNWEVEQNLVGELYDRAWPHFLRQALVSMPDDVRRFGSALVGNMKVVDALIDQAPKTLVHGDFRVENIHFGNRNNQAICWLIDWEDVFWGSGMVDVSWFLGGCLPIEESHHEMRILQHYYQTLHEEGIKNYSWERCYYDYRCGMVSSFVQGVLSATLDDDANEEEHHLAQVVSQRFIYAAQHLHLAEILSV
ncbi:MAG: phosphotransferase [Anaerolineales bacterium]|nr:phosphotransferase [Anaerolineales bacterium]